jgi:hypothetical protein
MEELNKEEFDCPYRDAEGHCAPWYWRYIKVQKEGGRYLIRVGGDVFETLRWPPPIRVVRKIAKKLESLDIEGLPVDVYELYDLFKNMFTAGGSCRCEVLQEIPLKVRCAAEGGAELLLERVYGGSGRWLAEAGGSVRFFRDIRTNAFLDYAEARGFSASCIAAELSRLLVYAKADPSRIVLRQLYSLLYEEAERRCRGGGFEDPRGAVYTRSFEKLRRDISRRAGEALRLLEADLGPFLGRLGFADLMRRHLPEFIKADSSRRLYLEFRNADELWRGLERLAAALGFEFRPPCSLESLGGGVAGAASPRLPVAVGNLPGPSEASLYTAPLPGRQ